MINTDKMTDTELATCVDAFFQRAMRRGRDIGCERTISLQITAEQSYKDSEYTIEHRASIDWSNAYASKTNNLVKSVDNAWARKLEDMLTEPTTVRPLLEAPKPIEDADFTDVPSSYGDV